MKNKSTMIIVVILAIIAIGAIVYFGYFKNKNKNSNKPQDQITKDEGKVSSGVFSNKKEYSDVSGTFTISFPKDWVVLGKEKLSGTPAKDFDEAIVFNNDPNVFVGINGPKDKDKSHEKDLEGLTKALASKLQESMKAKDYNLEIIDQNFGTKDNYSYTYIVSKITKKDDNSKSVVQIQKNIIGKDKAFALIGSVAGNKYNDYKNTLNEIINSFKVK